MRRLDTDTGTRVQAEGGRSQESHGCCSRVIVVVAVAVDLLVLDDVPRSCCCSCCPSGVRLPRGSVFPAPLSASCTALFCFCLPLSLPPARHCSVSVCPSLCLLHGTVLFLSAPLSASCTALFCFCLPLSLPPARHCSVSVCPSLCLLHGTVLFVIRIRNPSDHSFSIVFGIDR